MRIFHVCWSHFPDADGRLQNVITIKSLQGPSGEKNPENSSVFRLGIVFTFLEINVRVNFETKLGRLPKLGKEQPAAIRNQHKQVRGKNEM